MIYRKDHIFVIVSFCTGFCILSTILILLFSGMTASYSLKTFITTPALRYFWVFISFIILIEICIIYNVVKNYNSTIITRRLYVLMISMISTAAIFVLALSYVDDTPFSYTIDNERYEIPWEYGPDAGTSEKRAGNYIRVAVSYPDFLPLELRGTPKWADESRMRLARQTIPDYLCFGGIGCDGTPPRSPLPPSELLLEKVNAHLRIVEGDMTIQQARALEGEGEGEGETLYFYQAGHNNEPRMYGLCRGLPRFMACALLVNDGKYFYNIWLGTDHQDIIRNFEIDSDLQVIEVKTIRLFDSFIVR